MSGPELPKRMNEATITEWTGMDTYVNQIRDCVEWLMNKEMGPKSCPLCERDAFCKTSFRWCGYGHPEFKPKPPEPEYCCEDARKQLDGLANVLPTFRGIYICYCPFCGTKLCDK